MRLNVKPTTTTAIQKHFNNDQTNDNRRDNLAITGHHPAIRANVAVSPQEAQVIAQTVLAQATGRHRDIRLDVQSGRESGVGYDGQCAEFIPTSVAAARLALARPAARLSVWKGYHVKHRCHHSSSTTNLNQ